MSTLSNITSSCNKQTISIFLKNVIDRLEDPKKVCVLLHDEVYIKKSMQFHGGEIFGRAANDPSLLAETMLGQMLICLHPPEGLGHFGRGHLGRGHYGRGHLGRGNFGPLI